MRFCIEKHKSYLARFVAESEDSYQYKLMEYIKMNVVLWSVTSLILVKQEDCVDVDQVADFVRSCYNEADGGFAPAPGFNSQLHSTLSAVQIATTLNRMDLVDVEAVSRFVMRLQNNDGSFQGDVYGEVDTRFCYCAISCLQLIGQLHLLDKIKTARFILNCFNQDGSFGTVPEAESHAGQVFCCVAALKILFPDNFEQFFDAEKLCLWLIQRQCMGSGGLNGRPEKTPDTCYGWWILSILTILNKMHWIDEAKLVEFTLSCQDTSDGGFTDHPGDEADIYHTHFGLCAMSLLLNNKNGEELEKINPVFCVVESKLNKHFF